MRLSFLAVQFVVATLVVSAGPGKPILAQNADYLSDPYILKDFFEGDYRDAVQRGLYYLTSRAVMTPRGADLQQGTMYAQGLAAMALATRFDVQPQDVVFVGPANITRWNRFISQLVPSASIIGIGASAQNNLSEASSR